MRALKVTGFLLGGLLALLLLALLALRFLVNPNDFKGRIVSAVHESTGRELQLPGDIRLSVFPWVHLEFGPASLGNPPGFDARPFVAVRRVDLRVKLLPLLHKELRVGRVVVDGLDLRLLKNRAGAGNWQGLGGKDQPPEPDGQRTSAVEALRDLGGLTLRNGRVSYQDQVIEGLDLEVGRMAPGVTTPVRIKLRLASAAGATPTDLDGRLDLTPDPAASRYRLNGLELSAARRSTGGGAVNLKLGVPQMNVDLAAQTLGAAAFSAEAGGATLSGSLHGERIIDSPAIAGTFRLAPCSPRKVLAALGYTVPPMRDGQAFSALSASGQFAYSSTATQLSGLRVQLDGSSLTGRAGISDKGGSTIGFELALDHADLDRYRAPPAPVAKDASAPAVAQEQGTALKTLRLDGRLTAGQVRVAGVTLSRLTAVLAARDGVLRAAPTTATLYDGTLRGDLALDSRAAVPRLQIDETLDAVAVAPLLRDLMGKPSRISGRGHVVTHLSARGSDAAAIMRSLSGHLAARLDGGAVEGVDLWFEINRAAALIGKGALSAGVLSAGSDSGRTRFDAFSATADLTDGVATTRDLNIVSQNLRLAGQGTFNIVSEAVNYQVHAMVLKQPTAGPVNNANLLADIPATITGTLTHPAIRPDLQGIARARVQQELDKHKGELQQKLQDQLQKLFK
ncbi:MAG: AsmA family protein [Proteobacteria bacterium]|nr:AsmA family protein [Pseudomonadota bacterium]